MKLELDKTEFKTYDTKYISWFFITLLTLGLVILNFPEYRIAATTVVTAIVAFNVAVALSIVYRKNRSVNHVENP